MTVRVLTGDCRDVLRSLPAESVDCIVTSPPYYGLRDYGVSGQIGLEPTPDAFVKELVGVFAECRRVLKDSGVMFLNLGDSYWTGGTRQTGRNDTDRETPGGRGGSFRGGVRRAIACDTSGKEPEGSPASDCLCQSLCDACREAYRIGKFHSGSRHASTQLASSSASILAHTGLPSDHLPTLGLARQGDRSSDAIRDPQLSPNHEGALPHASPESTYSEFSQRPQEGSRRSGNPSTCLLCGRSLADCVSASAGKSDGQQRKHDGTQDSASPCAGLPLSNQGTDECCSIGGAYPDFTTGLLKPKDLIGVPWMVAFALRADGWYLRSDIIWSKPNPMPESVTDRPTKAHEYLFLLSKSKSYFFDADAIKEPGSEPPRAKEGGAGESAIERKLRGFDNRMGSDGSRNIRSVWTVATQPYSEAHFATFPPDLIEPCIKAGCPAHTCAKCGAPWVRDYRGTIPSCECDWAYTAPPGVVLDPFGGAGTTGLVADRLQRNAILIEINPTYAEMAQRRVANDGGMFARVAAA